MSANHVIDVTFWQSNRLYFCSFVEAINKAVKFSNDLSYRFVTLFYLLLHERKAKDYAEYNLQTNFIN